MSLQIISSIPRISIHYLSTTELRKFLKVLSTILSLRSELMSFRSPINQCKPTCFLLLWAKISCINPSIHQLIQEHKHNTWLKNIDRAVNIQDTRSMEWDMGRVLFSIKMAACIKANGDSTRCKESAVFFISLVESLTKDNGKMISSLAEESYTMKLHSLWMDPLISLISIGYKKCGLSTKVYIWLFRIIQVRFKRWKRNLTFIK